VRGVTAEWRTRRLNCRARLRSAELLSVFFSMRPQIGRSSESDRTTAAKPPGLERKNPLTNRSYLILKQIRQGLLDRSNRSQF
jgi:hypothetical protein